MALTTNQIAKLTNAARAGQRYTTDGGYTPIQKEKIPIVSKQQQQPNYYDQYRTQTATIDDISNKYGFDYSRDYAKRVADAEYQAKKDAVESGKRSVDSNVSSANNALDHNYFQQMLATRQGQANSGLNAGLASDQDTRLMMNRQAQMGDIYRDANLQRSELEDLLARADLERLAREDSLYNERLQQGFQNSLAYTDSQRANNQVNWSQEVDRAGLTGKLNGQDTVQEQQRGFQNAVTEGQLTGNYMSSQAKNYASQLLELKQQAEKNWTSMTPQQRKDISAEGDRITALLNGLGVNIDNNTMNAKQLQQALAGGSLGTTTLGGRQTNLQELTTHAGLTGQLPNGNATWQAQMDLAQLLGTYNGQDTLAKQNQQFQQGLAESQVTGYYNGKETLAREMFDAEYTKLTKYQQRQIDMMEQELNAESSLKTAMENGEYSFSALDSVDQKRYWEMWESGSQEQKDWLASMYPEIFTVAKENGISEWDARELINKLEQAGIDPTKAKDEEIMDALASMRGQFGWTDADADKVWEYLQDYKTTTQEKKSENSVWNSIKNFFSGAEGESGYSTTGGIGDLGK